MTVGQSRRKACLEVRHLLGPKAAQPVALRLEMDLHEDAEEMHEGRHDRGKDDGRVGQVEELDHQERRGAHDRRRDLPAGRGGGFDRRREVLLVAEADHRRDGQRADRHGVRDGGARDHAEQGRAEDRDLRRPAGIAAGDPGGAIEEELPETDPRREDAEQHEVEHVGGDDAERDAVDALRGEIEVVDELREAGAGVDQDARHVAAEHRVEHEHAGDDRQRPADRPSRRLEQHQDQHAPEHHVDGLRVADPEGEVIERDQWHMRDCDHRADRERPVEKRDAERAPEARAGGRIVVVPLREREDEEDQPEHEGEVDAAVHGLLQEAEAGRVVVEDRERDQQRADELSGERRERAEADLGIELLFELAGLRLVEFHGGHDRTAICHSGARRRREPGTHKHMWRRLRAIISTPSARRVFMGSGLSASRSPGMTARCGSGSRLSASLRPG